MFRPNNPQSDLHPRLAVEVALRLRPCTAHANVPVPAAAGSDHAASHCPQCSVQALDFAGDGSVTVNKAYGCNPGQSIVPSVLFRAWEGQDAISERLGNSRHHPVSNDERKDRCEEPTCFIALGPKNSGKSFTLLGEYAGATMQTTGGFSSASPFAVPPNGSAGLLPRCVARLLDKVNAQTRGCIFLSAGRLTNGRLADLLTVLPSVATKTCTRSGGYWTGTRARVRRASSTTSVDLVTSTSVCTNDGDLSMEGSCRDQAPASNASHAAITCSTTLTALQLSEVEVGSMKSFGELLERVKAAECADAEESKQAHATVYVVHLAVAAQGRPAGPGSKSKAFRPATAANKRRQSHGEGRVNSNQFFPKAYGHPHGQSITPSHRQNATPRLASQSQTAFDQQATVDTIWTFVELNQLTDLSTDDYTSGLVSYSAKGETERPGCRLSMQFSQDETLEGSSEDSSGTGDIRDSDSIYYLTDFLRRCAHEHSRTWLILHAHFKSSRRDLQIAVNFVARCVTAILVDGLRHDDSRCRTAHSRSMQRSHTQESSRVSTHSIQSEPTQDVPVELQQEAEQAVFTEPNFSLVQQLRARSDAMRAQLRTMTAEVAGAERAHAADNNTGKGGRYSSSETPPDEPMCSRLREALAKAVANVAVGIPLERRRELLSIAEKIYVTRPGEVRAIALLLQQQRACAQGPFQEAAEAEEVAQAKLQGLHSSLAQEIHSATVDASTTRGRVVEASRIHQELQKDVKQLEARFLRVGAARENAQHDAIQMTHDNDLQIKEACVSLGSAIKSQMAIPNHKSTHHESSWSQGGSATVASVPAAAGPLPSLHQLLVMQFQQWINSQVDFADSCVRLEHERSREKDLSLAKVSSDVLVLRTLSRQLLAIVDDLQTGSCPAGSAPPVDPPAPIPPAVPVATAWRKLVAVVSSYSDDTLSQSSPETQTMTKRM
eukprot:GHVT01008136.1.p1 GENE.GHVT01008136.1~~GHVT01008136.1.p1  ORF type:complete len:947 (+),score=92.17 GHVT01008136.1:569-3409(+)